MWLECLSPAHALYNEVNDTDNHPLSLPWTERLCILNQAYSLLILAKGLLYKLIDKLQLVFILSGANT